MRPRETSGSFDQASMSDGSGSELDKILDLMQMIMSEKQEIAHQLEQANHKVRELTHQLGETTRERDDLRNTTRELTNRWKRTLRERDDLANQLKETHLEGESSSQSTNLEEVTSQSIRKWFERECQN